MATNNTTERKNEKSILRSRVLFSDNKKSLDKVFNEIFLFGLKYEGADNISEDVTELSDLYERQVIAVKNGKKRNIFQRFLNYFTT